MILRQAVWLLCALFMLTLAAADPTQEYILSLTDQSPTIFYSPTVWGNGSNSWNVSYSLSPWNYNNPSYPTSGQGRSSHWTNTTDAVISFNFVGTGFAAYGELSGSANIQVQIDLITINVQPAASNGPMQTRPTLASASGLTYGWHQVSLTMKGSGGLEFTGLDVSLAAGDVGATYTNITDNCTTSDDLLNQAFIWSTNGWATTADGPSNSYNSPVNSTYVSVASTQTINSSVSFSPPSNTSIMIIYGAVDPTTGSYDVHLSSDVYAGSYTNKTQPQWQSYRPVTPWQEINQVLYYGSLVPGHTYAVTVQLTGAATNNATKLDLTLINVVFISSSTDGPSTTTSSIIPSQTQSGNSGGGGSTSRDFNKVGTIVGSVLGGMAAALIILGIWWCCNRKRRRTGEMYVRTDHADNSKRTEAKSPDGEKPFDVDPYVETTDRHLPVVQPFSPDTQSPQESSAGATPVGTYNEKASMTNFSTPREATASGSSNSVSSPPTSVNLRGSPHDTLQINTGPTHLMDGLDPADPAFARKWEILHNLDTDTSNTPSPSLPSAGSPSTARTREVDAGRLEGGEDTLPPDYNPAWAPRR